MTGRIGAIIFLTGAMAVLVSPVNALNLFSNGGFESTSTDWKLQVTAPSNATANFQSPDAAHSGAQGARIQVTAAEPTNNWHIQLNTPTGWTAKKGVTYHLSFWAKAEASHAASVAVSDGPPKYAYRTSSAIAVGPSWKFFETWYKSDSAGVGAVRFNLYLAAEVGTYDFDDFSLDTVASVAGANIVQPTEGAWKSGKYRNLFLEHGYAKADIDAKVNAAFQQLFFGDNANERIYRTVGSDEAFIDAVDSKDIRTEGMSYGMIISVMMDRQDLFNKLWKFAKTRMQNKTGDAKGYFAWHVANTPPYSAVDVIPAPDGEEYFVTSLFLASRRWGNGNGIFQYQVQADSLLTVMLTPHGSVGPLIDPVRKMIVFSPGISPAFTDPSYHLPAFYRLWAAFSTHHQDVWNAMADSSLAFLPRTVNATTGLMPEYASFDGAPQATSFYANSTIFAADASRVGMNIGVDWAWFQSKPWEMTQNKRELGFFASQTGGYVSLYSLDGKPQVTYRSENLVATNAVAVLASDRSSDWAFIDALWQLPVASGTYRYYNGLLQLMGLLHASGKFQAYGSPGMTTGIVGNHHAKTGLSVKIDGRDVIVEGASWARLLDLRGKSVEGASAVGGDTRLHIPRAGTWIVQADQGRVAKVTMP